MEHEARGRERVLFGAAWIGEVIALVTWWVASSVSLWAAIVFAATTTRCCCIPGQRGSSREQRRLDAVTLAGLSAAIFERPDVGRAVPKTAAEIDARRVAP